MEELSLADKGISFDSCIEAIQSFIKEHKKRPPTLTLTKNHAIGVDGITSLAETWLARSPDSEKEDDILTLNVASCSLGRCVNPSTGANILTSTGLSALGIHGNRLKNVDLGWNDLNSEAIDAFVRGLLDIKGPSFDAESFDPATLIPSRSCALESLNLKGNSICDEGLESLARLLDDPSQTLKSPSNLRSLNLTQCALEENGAEILCKHLNSDSPKLVSLNCRENDFKSGNRALAEAAVNCSTLVEFNEVNLPELKEKLSADEEGISIVAGKDAMCHGVLSLLLTLRPFVYTNSTENPIVEGVPPKRGSVAIDLKGSNMCGFYWEEVEAVDELIALLERANESNFTSGNSKSPEIESGEPAAEPQDEPVQYGSPLFTISKVEIDDDCGLTQNQIKAVYDACGPATQKNRTKLFVNGLEFKPSWGCVIS
jgi:hypothetical protein